jgi:LacI family repressor for deo operon, udp, cdd, tsx, nupC, and nupG
VPQDGRVSIRRVAEAAGVAIGTVSKALNGDREISEGTRTRVQRVARELGYRPMAQARGLARGRTGNVAVAIRSVFRPVFTSAFYSEVLAGVEAELEKHDLNLLLTSLKRGDDLLRLASERRADGVLYIGYDVEAAFLRQLRASTPLVVVDGEVAGISSVVSENLVGSRAATRHLLARGRRRLAFAVTTLEQPNFRTRHQGFREVLGETGLEPGPTVQGWGFADVCAAVRALLSSYRPDGIVCANDSVGYMVLQALETLAVRVPEEVALVGYDGTTGAEYRKARLSTMAVDKQELGAAGVRLLLEHVERPQTLPRQIVIPTWLEPGDTS